MDSLLNFLNMGGYAIYVWSAYGIVLGILTFQLVLAWRRWQKINKQTTLIDDQ